MESQREQKQEEKKLEVLKQWEYKNPDIKPRSKTKLEEYGNQYDGTTGRKTRKPKLVISAKKSEKPKQKSQVTSEEEKKQDEDYEKYLYLKRNAEKYGRTKAFIGHAKSKNSKKSSPRSPLGIAKRAGRHHL